MNTEDRIIGVVRNGELTELGSELSPELPFKLTRAPIQAGHGPEAQAIDLRPYEGHVIMVTGERDEGWVRSARIIDEAGPLLTVIILKIYEGHEVTF